MNPESSYERILTAPPCRLIHFLSIVKSRRMETSGPSESLLMSVFTVLQGQAFVTRQRFQESIRLLVLIAGQGTTAGDRRMPQGR